MDQNEEHLKLLAVFHYVVSAIAGLFSLFPVIHLVLGLAMLSGRFPGGGKVEPDARLVGGFFVGFAVVWIAIGLMFAICIFFAGRNIARRTRYMYCLVVAAVECMFMPFGTVLGVFTLLVLMKEPVKVMFGAAPVMSA
jgi:hypothetical protein